MGVLGFAGAGVTGGFILRAGADVDTNCNATYCTKAESYNSAATGRALLVPNAVAWGVGIAGVAVGAGLFIFGGKRPSSQRETSFVIGPQGIGMRGSF